MKLECNSTKRPCYVNGDKALFHSWTLQAMVVDPSPFVGGHPGGQVYSPAGIVELENGYVMLVNPVEIVFADGGDFHEYIWLDVKKEKENG